MAKHSKQGDPNKIVGYVRVSTAEQAHGPKAQIDALTAFCARVGAELVAVHYDLGVSGSTPLTGRPGLVAAIADVCQLRAGFLLVAKRDRLARNPTEAGLITRDVVRCGARVLSADGVGVDDTPAGRFRDGLDDLVAAYELDLIKARTRAALAAKKARGERVGAIPFGKRLSADGVHLEDDPAEQAAVARIMALRAEGKSVRRIIAALDFEGVPARSGKWHPTAVVRIVDAAAAVDVD